MGHGAGHGLDTTGAKVAPGQFLLPLARGRKVSFDPSHKDVLNRGTSFERLDLVRKGHGSFWIAFTPAREKRADEGCFGLDVLE